MNNTAVLVHKELCRAEARGRQLQAQRLLEQDWKKDTVSQPDFFKPRPDIRRVFKPSSFEGTTCGRVAYLKQQRAVTHYAPPATRPDVYDVAKVPAAGEALASTRPADAATSSLIHDYNMERPEYRFKRPGGKSQTYVPCPYKHDLVTQVDVERHGSQVEDERAPSHTPATQTYITVKPLVRLSAWNY